MRTNPGLPSTMNPSLRANVNVLAMTLSGAVACGLETRRDTSTFTVDALSVRPPA